MESSRRNKLYAVLAGGLVLGVGAAVTLAAWNDSEFATGTFTAGSFDLQGSTDGSSGWASHETDPGATLDFTVDADNLAPDDSVYALYSIRLVGTTDGDLTNVAPTTAGANAANLTAETHLITGTTCDATTFAAGSAILPTTITAGTAATATPVNYCLQVTAGADLVQGAEGTVTWQWTAASQ